MISASQSALLLNFYGAINKYTSSVAGGDWIKSETFSYYLARVHCKHFAAVARIFVPGKV